MRPEHSSGPPRWVGVGVFAALAALLYYPIQVPYQNPDQDYPGLALLELVRGGWEPWTIYYPSALTTLLRVGYELVLVGARLVGRPLDAIDLCAAFVRDPTPFRVAPRLIAMTAGVVSLAAVARLVALLTDRWSGLFAAALLGTSYMFVREHDRGVPLERQRDRGCGRGGGQGASRRRPHVSRAEVERDDHRS